MSDIFEVSGRSVVVTGAASGLGLAIAQAFARRGAAVTMVDRASGVASRAEALAEEGLDVSSVQADIADADSIASAIDSVLSRRGTVDVLFANAGVSGGPGKSEPEGALEELDLRVWNDIVRVNLTGVFLTLRAAAPAFKAQGAGSAVVTTSLASLLPSPFVSYAYNAAKAGAANVVRQAALELAPYGVRVNGIAPGPFRTSISGGKWLDPAVDASRTVGVPLRRTAAPEEIVGTALYLASAASAYVTGVILPVDGGLSASFN